MDYDDWGHVCRVTESNSVVTSTFMDLVTLTCRKDVNRQNKRLTQFNNFGTPTKISLLNRDDTVYATAEATYDGLGRSTSRQVGGRTTRQTYEGSTPKPSSITTPTGDTYNFTYEPR